MIEKSLITRTEREVYLGYEHERRVRMLSSITPIFMAICAAVVVILGLALLVLPESVVAHSALLVTMGMLACCVVALGLGLVAARRGHLNLATALVAGTSALGTSSSLAIWSAYLGMDPFAMIELTPFSVVIVLAGLLGNIRWVVLATLVMNVATVSLLLVVPLAPGLGPVFGRELPLIIPVALAHQWLFALLMIVIWRVFQRTLGAVGVAYERAQQLDVLKDEFIASVNHELRTPLMTMQTYLETLREVPDQLPPEQLREVLDQVCRVSDSLVELVQSILSARQIDTETIGFTLERVALAPVLEAAVRLIDPGASQDVPRELTLGVPKSLAVWGEPVRLQQIFTNLLSNAVKYSPPGTPIEVRVRVLDNTPSSSRGRRQRTRPQPNAAPLVQISVRDYGYGIPPEQAPLLFNRFVRLPRDLASKVTGTGLGLYLCRILVESLGGRIWVESTGVDGEGSTFYVTLTLASAARPHAQTSAPVHAATA
jgi:signal transduction histidine kinase